MGVDEEGTHERLRGHLRELIEPKIAEHRGRVVKNTGDGFLAEFPSVVDAVRCAVEVQRGLSERNAGIPPEKRIEFRVGINLGDVIAEEHDIFGDGVNVAARLKALADPGGICVSRVVRDQVRDRLNYRSRTSRGQCVCIPCALKASPAYQRQACRPTRQVRRRPLRRACRSSCCPSPTSATIRSSNILPTGSPKM